jgi:hypothetical protein
MISQCCPLTNTHILTCTHTCTHTYTHIHAHIHTCACICAHIYKHTYTCVRTDTHTQHTNTWVHTHLLWASTFQNHLCFLETVTQADYVGPTKAQVFCMSLRLVPLGPEIICFCHYSLKHWDVLLQQEQAQEQVRFPSRPSLPFQGSKLPSDHLLNQDLLLATNCW